MSFAPVRPTSGARATLERQRQSSHKLHWNSCQWEVRKFTWHWYLLEILSILQRGHSRTIPNIEYVFGSPYKNWHSPWQTKIPSAECALMRHGLLSRPVEPTVLSGGLHSTIGNDTLLAVFSNRPECNNGQDGVQFDVVSRSSTSSSSEHVPSLGPFGFGHVCLGLQFPGKSSSLALCLRFPPLVKTYY